jgi:heparan-alpha-glucosaminide N-acetyltransferase
MNNTTSTLPGSHAMRMPAVDLLRGFTMLLMVFVNDLWSLKGVPQWMLHVAPDADGMGLSDVVFPAFMFITGLSLPLAISARMKRGDGPLELVQHIVTRAFALIVMGLFLVNGEYLNAEATGMSRHAWYVSSCAAFILIWNQYPGLKERKWVKLFRSAGILLLLSMAWIYRGGQTGIPYVFKPHWWGILGLIGWAYLAAGLVTVAASGRTAFITAGWIAFALISMMHHAGNIPRGFYILTEPIIGGTMTALALGGVLTMTVYQSVNKGRWNRKQSWMLPGIVTLLVAAYLITRPIWGLSKQHATPAWLFICSAITLTGFAIMILVANGHPRRLWLHPLRMAGANTLLTYLMPFFGYALASLIPWRLPEWFVTSPVGLLKSVLFALICAEVAGRLGRRWIRLQL